MRFLKNSHWIYAALVGVLAVAAGGVLIGIQYVAKEQNRSSVETQQQIASSLVDSLLSSLAGNVTAQAYWQEAYESTSVQWNSQWINWEYGDYLRSLDVPISLIFSPTGELKHFYEDSAVKIAGRQFNSWEFRGNSLRELLDAVVNQGPGKPPRVARGFVSINGTVFYGAAAYVTPEHGEMTRNPARRHILVFLREMIPSRYAGFAQYTHTSGFALARPHEKFPGKVSLPLRSPNGQIVARLWWTPYQPGSALLSTILPVAIGIFVVLGIVLILILRTWQTLTANTYAAHAMAKVAQEENLAKSTFLGNLSHELRTPLNAIIGFSDLLKQEMLGPIGIAKYKEYIEHIHSSGTHLLRIVNDLLEMVKLESKGMEVSCAAADVNDTIERACAMFGDQAESKNIRILRAATEGPCRAYFDHHALLRVLINILGNAFKFTPDGGQIAISVEVSEDDMTVVIKDSGIGIKANDIKRLGKPFTQVGDYRSMRNQGTGLGLSICRQLLDLMNGKMFIASKFGEGTTVSVALPRYAPATPGTSTLRDAA